MGWGMEPASAWAVVAHRPHKASLGHSGICTDPPFCAEPSWNPHGSPVIPSTFLGLLIHSGKLSPFPLLGPPLFCQSCPALCQNPMVRVQVPESDGDNKANISASFVAFVYGGGEKNSNCKEMSHRRELWCWLWGICINRASG